MFDSLGDALNSVLATFLNNGFAVDEDVFSFALAGSQAQLDPLPFLYSACRLRQPTGPIIAL